MDDKRLNKLLENFYLLLPLFRRTLFYNKKFLKEKQISPSMFRVLKILKKRGATPMSEIGKKVYISKSNMTSLIDKLVEEGLAERLPDKEDRRVINISITPKGEGMLQKWAKMENKELKDKLSALSDEDLENFYESVETMKKILHKIEKK